MRRFGFWMAIFFVLALVIQAGQLGGGLMFPGPGNGSSSSGGGGTPSIPTGMAVWYSADCITYTAGTCGVPADGTSLTSWADRSGNGDTATVATGTCTFHVSQLNSQPAITASNCGLTLATSIGPGPGRWTVFAVIKRSDVTAKEILFGSNSAAAFGYGTGDTNASIVRQQGVDSTDYSFQGDGTASASLTWHQMNVAYQNAFSGGTQSYRLDRTDDGSPALANANNIVNANTSLLYDQRNNNLFFAGQVAELIYYNSLLTSTQITQVETYLNSKYGL